jgi:hypothetical protein
MITVHFAQLLLDQQLNALQGSLKRLVKTFNKNPYICFGFSMNPSSGGVTKLHYLFKKNTTRFI